MALLFVLATVDDDISSTTSPPPTAPSPLAEASFVLDGSFLPYLDLSSNLFALMRELEASRKKFN